jgi:hypothetical protein
MKSTLPMPDESVPVLDPEPAPIIDSQVSEPLLNYAEALAWLDDHAPDWRQFRAHPPYVFAFGRRWFDVRELRAWIGR